MIEIPDTGISVHLAFAEVEPPICLSGQGDAGLTVNIYWREGEILGVAVFDETTKLVASAGLVAAEDVR